MEPVDGCIIWRIECGRESLGAIRRPWNDCWRRDEMCCIDSDGDDTIESGSTAPELDGE